MDYSELSEEQRAAMNAAGRRRLERQQERECAKAVRLGMQAAGEDKMRAFNRRLAARNGW